MGHMGGKVGAQMLLGAWGPDRTAQAGQRERGERDGGTLRYSLREGDRRRCHCNTVCSLPLKSGDNSDPTK